MTWLRELFRRLSEADYRKRPSRRWYGDAAWWLYINVILPTNDVYYFARYRIRVRGGGTMLPHYGKGKYVSVYDAGGIIRIVSETDPGHEVRIVPYQPNHGVMVEIIGGDKDSPLSCYSLDLKQLSKSLIYASNVEELCGRKRRQEDTPAAGAEEPVETRRRL
jgi:hypothetical protein